MEINKIIQALTWCQDKTGTCKGCPEYNEDSGYLDRVHSEAAAALEAQQKRIAELEEIVTQQRKRASDAGDFICMLCTECGWERNGDTIIMSKHCCELGMPECGKFKLRGTDPGRWVPVTERLPKLIPCDAGTEYSEAVNVLTSGRKVLTAIWDGTDFIADAEFWEAEGEEITHWTPVLLPLPKPQKEDDQK